MGIPSMGYGAMPGAGFAPYYMAADPAYPGYPYPDPAYGQQPQAGTVGRPEPSGANYQRGMDATKYTVSLVLCLCHCLIGPAIYGPRTPLVAHFSDNFLFFL